MGWAVDQPQGRHDRHLTKEEAVLRARQLVMGEERARIEIQGDASDEIERDIWIGRPSIPSLTRH
jgi:hypothetical protein